VNSHRSCSNLAAGMDGLTAAVVEGWCERQQ
jgi:hypothetical protein